MRSRAMPALIGLLIGLACTFGIGRDTVPPSSAAEFGVAAEAKQVRGGCGSTSAYQGPVDPRLSEAAANNAPRGLTYVIADPPIAAGFLFGYPLRAGVVTKILWVVATPRAGADLVVEARPRGQSEPVVRRTSPANSGPGEIYPSELLVLQSGCWYVTLAWGTQRTSVSLLFD